MFRDALVQLLGIIGGVPYNSAQSVDQSDIEVGAQPIATASEVDIPPTSIVAQQIVAQLVVAQPSMSSEERKILDRFLRLALLRFFGALGENAQEFLIDCEVRFCGLGIVEACGVDCTTF